MRRLLPGLLVAAALYGPAAALQLSPEMTALRGDLATHLLDTRGERFWPNAGSATPAGAQGAEIRAAQDARQRNADMIQLDGVVTGPGGLRRPLTLTFPNAGGASYDDLGGGLWYGLSARGQGGVIDVAFAVRRDGRTFPGSIAGVGSGATVNLDLGGGHRLVATLTQRQATPDERRRNESTADLTRDLRARLDENLARAGAVPPPAPSGAPLIQSPLTNSVIREGDPRASQTP